MGLFGFFKRKKAPETVHRRHPNGEENIASQIGIVAEFADCLIPLGDCDACLPLFVTRDSVVHELRNEINVIYRSHYTFDYFGVPNTINEEQRYLDKDEVLCLLRRLEERLNEINDGSYSIENAALMYYSELEKPISDGAASNGLSEK